MQFLYNIKSLFEMPPGVWLAGTVGIHQGSHPVPKINSGGLDLHLGVAGPGVFSHVMMVSTYVPTKMGPLLQSICMDF